MLLKNISDRYSPRAFAETPVEQDKVQTLFEAARWAPSSYNLQPWRFIVGDKNHNHKTWQGIFDSLIDFNKAWANKAPVLILVAADNSGRENQENAHAWYDTGQAVANMSTQATSMGLYMHQMGGIDFESLAKTFNFPSSWKTVAVIALGYLGDTKDLPDFIQEIEKNTIRNRMPISEVVFYSSISK